MIRIDAIWLAVEPLDMRAGPDKALARVVQVFGSARPHTAYSFANLTRHATQGAGARWAGHLAGCTRAASSRRAWANLASSRCSSALTQTVGQLQHLQMGSRV